jgi:GMP synthase-like glutamine amidotransferase
MKIRILQNINIEDAGIFIDYFNRQHFSVQTIHAYRDALPEDHDYDLLLPLGTPDAVYDRHRLPRLARVYQYVQQAIEQDKAIFGICAGAQLLADILGGTAHRHTHPEIGGSEVFLTGDGKKDPLLAGFPDKFPVFQWHGDTFHLPEHARLLASSGVCPHQLFRLGKFVGVQFHLELNAAAVQIWAKTYVAELTQFGKTIPQIIEEFQQIAPESQPLALRLMENYLRLCPVA